jgi:hypothetical protein
MTPRKPINRSVSSKPGPFFLLERLSNVWKLSAMSSSKSSTEIAPCGCWTEIGQNEVKSVPMGRHSSGTARRPLKGATLVALLNGKRYLVADEIDRLGSGGGPLLHLSEATRSSINWRANIGAHRANLPYRCEGKEWAKRKLPAFGIRARCRVQSHPSVCESSPRS